LKSNGVEIIIVNNEKLSPQEELVHDLLSKQIGVIVEKYSVAIKKKKNIRSALWYTIYKR
jgi:predicted site-specific integrase-resolvase